MWDKGGRGGGKGMREMRRKVMYLSEFTPDVASSSRPPLHDHETHSVRTQAQDARLHVPSQGGHYSC